MPRKEAMTTRMRSIFDRAPLGIAYTSATGAVLEANQKLCAMLGYTAEELRGTTTLALAHPDDRARHERLTQDLHAGRLSLIDVWFMWAITAARW